MIYIQDTPSSTSSTWTLALHKLSVLKNCLDATTNSTSIIYSTPISSLEKDATLTKALSALLVCMFGVLLFAICDAHFEIQKCWYLCNSTPFSKIAAWSKKLLHQFPELSPNGAKSYQKTSLRRKKRVKTRRRLLFSKITSTPKVSKRSPHFVTKEANDVDDDDFFDIESSGDTMSVYNDVDDLLQTENSSEYMCNDKYNTLSCSGISDDNGSIPGSPKSILSCDTQQSSASSASSASFQHYNPACPDIPGVVPSISLRTGTSNTTAPVKDLYATVRTVHIRNLMSSVPQGFNRLAVSAVAAK